MSICRKRLMARPVACLATLVGMLMLAQPVMAEANFLLEPGAAYRTDKLNWNFHAPTTMQAPAMYGTYPPPLVTGWATYFLTPLAGWSIHRQNLRIRNGFQPIPATGAFAGLDSIYE